jgi:hypothetical protein
MTSASIARFGEFGVRVGQGLRAPGRDGRLLFFRSKAARGAEASTGAEQAVLVGVARADEVECGAAGGEGIVKSRDRD